jgi:hypothetical protein
MKLSSRKKLLEESENELNLIRLKIILESKDDSSKKEKIERLSKMAADKQTKKLQSELRLALEKFKSQSITMQREYEKEKKETGISIEDWYKKQEMGNKVIYQFERWTGSEYTDNLWDRAYLWLMNLRAGNDKGTIFMDKEGNEYLASTGEKIEPSTTLHGSAIRTIVSAINI